MSARDEVGRRIGDICVSIANRMTGEFRKCCASGAPFCQACEAEMEALRLKTARVVSGMPAAAVTVLWWASSEMLEKVVVAIVEPAVRQALADGRGECRTKATP